MKNKNKREKFSNQFVLLDNKSHIMEAFRMVRTNIEFSDDMTENKVFLITSSVQDEGKSTTVVNLGRVFAQSDYRTLIIDLDLRKPVIHKIFHLPGNVGVTSVATNRVQVGEAVQATEEPNLYVLTSGVRPVNPAEFLRSSNMENLIRFLKTKFDVILIDSPPSMAIADSSIISTYVDATILIASAGKVDYRCIQQSLQNLRNVNANILGCILNNMKMSESSYLYKNYYYSNY